MDLVNPFSGGLAWVSIKSSKYGYGHIYGYIDKTGTLVIEPRFEEADPFSEGLARVLVVGEHDRRYIDKTGKTVWPKRQLTVPKGFPSVEKTEQLIKAKPGIDSLMEWGYFSGHIDIQMVEIERVGIVQRTEMIKKEYLPVQATVVGTWKRDTAIGTKGDEEYLHAKRDFRIYQNDYGDWKVDMVK